MEGGGSDNAYWLAASENLAGGLAEVKRDIGPLIRLADSGAVHPDADFKGVSGRQAPWAEPLVSDSL